jgi:hypothetical protein
MHEQGEARAAAGGGPLEHVTVAVRIAKGSGSQKTIFMVALRLLPP